MRICFLRLFSCQLGRVLTVALTVVLVFVFAMLVYDIAPQKQHRLDYAGLQYWKISVCRNNGDITKNGALIMGFRYRKSINLGGGFRVNVSKSGIGYSFGTRGCRVTKTASGKTRTTLSIPGTGISYVEELPSEKPQTPKISPCYNAGITSSTVIKNGDASEMVMNGSEEILSAAQRIMSMDKVSTIGIIVAVLLAFLQPLFWILAALFVIIKIYMRTAGQVSLEYEIDDDQKELIEQRMAQIRKIASSKQLWRITESCGVTDRKYTGGAGQLLTMASCWINTEAPFPFKTSAKIVSFETKAEIITFLPDKLLVIQGKHIGMVDYADVSISVDTKRFIESGSVPDDAKVVGSTWQYVNKSGGPDRRFKNNRMLPVCLYGKMKLRSPVGLNTVIMFSKNPETVQ